MIQLPPELLDKPYTFIFRMIMILCLEKVRIAKHVQFMCTWIDDFPETVIKDVTEDLHWIEWQQNAQISLDFRLKLVF